MENRYHVAITLTDVGTMPVWYRPKSDVETTCVEERRVHPQFANLTLALVLPEQRQSHFAVGHESADPFRPLPAHRNGTGLVYFSGPQRIRSNSSMSKDNNGDNVDRR